MSRARNILLVLLAATTVGGGLLAWRQHRELAELRTAALQRHERAELQKRLWDLERRHRALQDQLAAPAPAPTPDAARPAALPETRSPRPGADPRADLRQQLQSVVGQFTAVREALAKPEVQALVAIQQRAAIESRYAALFRSLGLDAERTAKLKSLLFDSAAVQQDVASAALEQGLDPRTTAAAIRQLVADAQAGTDRALRDLLGDAGVARLRNYEQTEPQRMLVAELERRLSYTPAPLSADQAERLTTVLAAQAPPSGNTTATTVATSVLRATDLANTLAATAGFGSGSAFLDSRDATRSAAPITATAVAEAQTVLSPPQLAALQALQQQQQAQQQLQRVLRESFPGSPGSTSPRPTPPR